MRIRRSKRFEATVSTSSMNDIMFFLLLFFLIISSLANPNIIKVMLPQTQTSDKLNKQPVTLSVTADKKYFINDKPVPFENLEEQLLSSTTAAGDNTVVIRAESILTIQDLIDVLELGLKNQLRMVLATEKTSK